MGRNEVPLLFAVSFPSRLVAHGKLALYWNHKWVYPARISVKVFGESYWGAERDLRPSDIWILQGVSAWLGAGVKWCLKLRWARRYLHSELEAGSKWDIMSPLEFGEFGVWRSQISEVVLYRRGLFWVLPSMSYLRSCVLKAGKGNGHLYDPTIGLRSLLRCIRRRPHNCVLQTTENSLPVSRK